MSWASRANLVDPRPIPPIDCRGTFVDLMRWRAAFGGCMLDLSATETKLDEELQSCLLAANQVKLKALCPDNCVRLRPAILLWLRLLAFGVMGYRMEHKDSGEESLVRVHHMITRSRNRRNHAMTLPKSLQTRQTPDHALYFMGEKSKHTYEENKSKESRKRKLMCRHISRCGCGVDL